MLIALYLCLGCSPTNVIDHANHRKNRQLSQSSPGDLMNRSLSFLACVRRDQLMFLAVGYVKHIREQADHGLFQRSDALPLSMIVPRVVLSCFLSYGLLPTPNGTDKLDFSTTLYLEEAVCSLLSSGLSVHNEHDGNLFPSSTSQRRSLKTNSVD